MLGGPQSLCTPSKRVLRAAPRSAQPSPALLQRGDPGLELHNWSQT